MPPTLGATLLCSSRAGSDMGLLSSNSIVHRDWGRDIDVSFNYFSSERSKQLSY